MKRKIVITAAVFGLFAVIAGAFGAHGLEKLLTPKGLEVWHTAVQYQFYHVFALLFLSTIVRVKGGTVNLSYYFFTFGIILFSGSLYILACRDLIGLSWLIYLGPITPLGGVLFIAGWITLALAALRNL